MGNTEKRGGHERKLSKSIALVVLAKIKAGKSNVMAEARRLGVYHATLRKEMRAAIGSKQYEKLFSRPQRGALSKSDVLSAIANTKAGTSTISAERRRLGVGEETLPKAIRATIGAEEYAKLSRGRKRLTKPKPASRPPAPVTTTAAPRGWSNQHASGAPTLSQVRAGDFYCGRCGSDHIKTGTDGNGGGILWCVCGWTRAIPRVRATPETLVRRSSEKLFVVE